MTDKLSGLKIGDTLEFETFSNYRNCYRTVKIVRETPKFYVTEGDDKVRKSDGKIMGNSYHRTARHITAAQLVEREARGDALEAFRKATVRVQARAYRTSLVTTEELGKMSADLNRMIEMLKG